MRKSKGWFGFAAVCALTVALMLAAGCGNQEGQNPGEPPPGTSSAGANTASGSGGGAPADAGGGGAAIYAANNCANCHKMDGQGGMGGPDLTKVGAEEGHTKEWIAEHIKDPQSHNPGSKMPKFGDKIAEADLNTLAEWLASKK